jgi:uncharacterized protein YdhG (YjbR/CyaY superfamily)
MDNKQPLSSSIDEYIAAFPADIQRILSEIRATIHAAIPEATEKISYGMPTFYLQGNLVHFAAFKNHIGFYPTPDGIEEFQAELAHYESSKGTVRFPLIQPIPLDLFARIARYRASQNLQKAAAKKAPKKA